jgi:UDP-N-acetylglucosamine--N-acetylmuramyl-(pentapeptide) pyrophosphoryl-undecaprenol N-acetylglucosamine transferase
MRRITVMGYAVNGSGMGHLTRVLAIMRWMRRIARLSGITLDGYVLTTSEADGLALNEGFAAWKMPSKTAVRAAGIQKEDYMRLARQWVWHSLGLVKPDIFLVDTFPAGSFGELVNALDSAAKRVFIHRAMRDDVEQSEIVQAMLPLYDRILFPVEPGASARDVSPRVAARTRYVGPVMLRSNEEMRPREQARNRLGIPPEKLGVWVTAGGGGDPNAGGGIRATIRHLESERDLHLVIGAGPLYRGEPLRGPNITWTTDFNAAEDFSGIDMAISAAGFNSFYELLHAGVPTAFYAQEKIADEQARRMRAAADAGCGLALATQFGVPREEDVLAAIEFMRDPARRAELSEKAMEFVPGNSAREAAFHALGALLPEPLLEEAMEVGSTRFFVALARHGVDLDDVEGPLKIIRGARDMSPDEQADCLLKILAGAGVQGQTAMRMFKTFARQFAPPESEDEVELVIESALRVINAAAPFRDEQGALALLKSFGDTSSTTPEGLARALESFLGLLKDEGESLWRAVALLNNCRRESPALPALPALEQVVSRIREQGAALSLQLPV